MIKQIYLPTTQKYDRFTLSMAQHHPDTRQQVENNRQKFLGEISEAEAELDRLFADGYEIKSTTIVEDNRGGFIHYLLWKPDGDDDSEEARIPDMDEATFDEGFAAAEAIHQENYPDDERAYL